MHVLTIRTPYLTLIAAVLMSACGPEYNTQNALNLESADTLFVAAAWSWGEMGTESYWRGLRLGTDDVNRSGGLLGRQLEVVRFEDEASVTQGQLSAQRIANERRYFAVIGHLHSHVSIPAAVVYDRAGMIMLNPASTAPELTRLGLRFVFRTVNSDAISARQLSLYARSQGFERVVICYVGNEYGRGLANAFETWAHQLDIDVVDRRSYEPSRSGAMSSYARVVEDWQDLRFDAIFLAGAAPDAADLIRAIRESGLNQPIFGGDALDDERMLAQAGSAADGLVALSVFHPDNPNPEVERFRAEYRDRFGDMPDSWAARGYEAVSILAGAVRGAGSAQPGDIASQLRARGDWKALHGPLGFDADGEVIGRPGIAVRAREGRYSFAGEIAPGGGGEGGVHLPVAN